MHEEGGGLGGVGGSIGRGGGLGGLGGSIAEAMEISSTVNDWTYICRKLPVSVTRMRAAFESSKRSLSEALPDAHTC